MAGRLLVIVVLIGCGDPKQPPTSAPPSPPPPLVSPPLASATPADLVACRVDSDCQVFAAGCAHCGNGFDTTVVSINKAYADYGEVLAFTLPFFSCAEGGCNHPRSERVPICSRGQCARRETAYDENGSATTAEIATDPALLIPTPERELMAIAAQHWCTRARACGTAPTTCGGTLPERLDCAAATKCYAALDQLPCDALLDPLTAMDLPACRAARSCRRTP